MDKLGFASRVQLGSSSWLSMGPASHTRGVQWSVLELINATGRNPPSKVQNPTMQKSGMVLCTIDGLGAKLGSNDMNHPSRPS